MRRRPLKKPPLPLRIDLANRPAPHISIRQPVVGTSGQPRHTPLKWLLVALGGVIVAGIGLAARQGLSRWTYARLQESLARQVIELPEQDAGALILQLDSLDVSAIPVLAAALADPRQNVADAAQSTLGRFTADWQLLPGAEAAPRVAMLARELAVQADRIAVPRRTFLRDLATRLLIWPTESAESSAAETIACCELILRLPLPADTELRIAARPAARTDIVATEPAASPPAPTAIPLPQSLPPDETPLPLVVRTPSPRDPALPAPLPDASREYPQEPRQFLAPRAEKLSPP